jgi:single-strand DNA-binding protein
MNVVNLLGNVGDDPKHGTTQSGTSWASFSLATSTVYKGETQTQWHSCKAWGKTADFIVAHVRKGSKMAFEGTIVYRKAEKDGVKVTYTDIIIERCHFAGSKQTEMAAHTTSAQSVDQESTFEGQDLPF